MTEITYLQVFMMITVIWIAVRLCFAFKNKMVDWKREALLLTVFICLVVIARIVYFPWHHVDGHIDFLRFDPARILPAWFNLIPLVHLFDIYDGWQMNIIGNITMFIPVGIVWPLCFKKLDNVWKVLLAGMGLTVFIELSQLLFYERNSDVDDILLNSLGVFLGALIYFGIVKLKK